MLVETNHEKYGDFSYCAENHIYLWNKVVLSGEITEMKFSLGWILGDLESTLSAHYRMVEKRKFKTPYIILNVSKWLKGLILSFIS